MQHIKWKIRYKLDGIQSVLEEPIDGVFGIDYVPIDMYIRRFVDVDWSETSEN